MTEQESALGLMPRPVKVGVVMSVTVGLMLTALSQLTMYSYGNVYGSGMELVNLAGVGLFFFGVCTAILFYVFALLAVGAGDGDD